MGYRAQVTKPNLVGEWLRNYRKENDMSALDLQSVFDRIGTLGIPINRVEVTDSAMTKKVSQPIVDYFQAYEDEEGNEHELVTAFRKHNNDSLRDNYLI